MKRYESSVSRIACGGAAVVMTTITIGLLVVLPYMMELQGQTLSTEQVDKTLATTERHAANGSV